MREPQKVCDQVNAGDLISLSDQACQQLKTH